MAKPHITQISVRNFKSFRDVNVTMTPFTVIVGANASGKSNLIQILKFMRDAVWDGLDNAISMQGGCEYLRNFKIAHDEPTIIEFHVGGPMNWPIPIAVKKSPKRSRLLNPRISDATYRLTMHYKKKGMGLRSCNDSLEMTVDVCDVKGAHPMPKPTDEVLAVGKIKISSDRRRVRPEIGVECPGLPSIRDTELFPREIKKWLEMRRGEGDLPSARYLDFLGLNRILGGTALFDFDPKHAKKGTPISGTTRLDEDASNLALVLRRIKADKQKSSKFIALMKDLAPFIEDIGADESRDKSVMFKIRERYFGHRDLYAPFVSDGTVNMAALIVALYFDGRSPVVIEEPERNVHPYIIDRMVEMMADASSEKQVITTTHNPVLVSSVDPKSVLLVRRDSEGYSEIEKPVDKAEVQELLRSEIGLGRLLEQNQLGAPR